MHSSQQKDRKQRFKIQVIKKKVKRIQSTPHKFPVQSPIIKRDNTETRQSPKLSSNQFQITQRNPQSQERITEQRESFYRRSSHVKSKSQLWNDGGNCLISGAEQLGLESIVINSIMQKNIYKGISTLDDPFSFDFRVSEVLDKKLSEHRTHMKKTKPNTNPFKDLNIVKCQSITLLQANRRNRQLLKPSKYLHSNLTKQSTNSISRRKIKITATNQNKIMSFNLSTDIDAMYMKKLKNYLDFLFKVNFSNRIFINFQLQESQVVRKYKVYVGWGNNCNVVKNCLRNRFWIEIVDKIDEDVRFCWTPWPSKDIYSKQKDRKVGEIQSCSIVSPKRIVKKQQQNIDLNQKLFTNLQSNKVQNFIVPDGYIVPFTEHKSPHLITNHLSNSSSITEKKRLFHSLFHYCRNTLKTNPFDLIPLTYNVTGTEDPQYKRFMRDNQGRQSKVWIIKPGENTNRGQGIFMAKTEDVFKYITAGYRHSFVIQSYIQRPLLYNGRKFDVRHFLLLTSVNGILKAYWFKQGYVRTSSQIFDLENLTDKFIHLTNDAIQQHSQNYGLFEAGNKISYSELQRYLQTIFPKRNFNFESDILEKVKNIICKVIKANYKILDCGKKQANFQLLGIDFMVDRDLKPWLIEINENPCLETGCQLLSRLIPSVVQNTLRLCVDPLLPPLDHFPSKLRSSLNDHHLKSLRYKIIFDGCQQIKLNAQN